MSLLPATGYKRPYEQLLHSSFPPFPSSHRPQRAYCLFRFLLLLFFFGGGGGGYPTGASVEESDACTNN